MERKSKKYTRTLISYLKVNTCVGKHSQDKNFIKTFCDSVYHTPYSGRSDQLAQLGPKNKIDCTFPAVFFTPLDLAPIHHPYCQQSDDTYFSTIVFIARRTNFTLFHYRRLHNESLEWGIKQPDLIFYSLWKIYT